MRQQRIFTEDERLLMVSLYKDGMSTGAISKQFNTSTNKISSILSEEGVQFRTSGRKMKEVKTNQPHFIRETSETSARVVKVTPSNPKRDSRRDPLQPPVGDVWKPWMIPTKVFIPEDESKLNWDEYAKDYDERKKMCDERNALLRKKQSI